MSSVSDLIHSSFRLIGAIAAGELLETNELNDAFVSFNQMIGNWNTEGLSLAGRMPTLININNQNNHYALPTRPVKIVSASVSVQGVDSPLEIVDAMGWEAIPEKLTMAYLTKKLFCDYQYPTATIWLWPLQRGNAVLEYWSFAPIAPFVTVNDAINLPPGYEQALRYNFAIAILPEYPRSQADPSLPAQAQSYKASLVQLNASNHQITQVPPAVLAAAAQPG